MNIIEREIERQFGIVERKEENMAQKYLTTSTGYSPVDYNWNLGIYGQTLTIPSYFKPVCKLPNKYIINDGATILFWEDGSKTISKRHKEDVFDKELGFLFAYYYKHCGLSNGARKRVIDSIDYTKIKTFLFEMFVDNSGKTYEQARSYLKNLKVEK